MSERLALEMGSCSAPWDFKKTKLTDPKDQRIQGFYRAVSFSLLEQIARGPGCSASD